MSGIRARSYKETRELLPWWLGGMAAVVAGGLRLSRVPRLCQGAGDSRICRRRVRARRAGDRPGVLASDARWAARPAGQTRLGVGYQARRAGGVPPLAWCGRVILMLSGGPLAGADGIVRAERASHRGGARVRLFPGAVVEHGRAWRAGRHGLLDCLAGGFVRGCDTRGTQMGVARSIHAAFRARWRVWLGPLDAVGDWRRADLDDISQASISRRLTRARRLAVMADTAADGGGSKPTFGSAIPFG